MTAVNLTAILAISVIAAAYCLFLWATWQQYQKDRAANKELTDTILDRLPQKVQPNED